MIKNKNKIILAVMMIIVLSFSACNKTDNSNTSSTANESGETSAENANDGQSNENMGEALISVKDNSASLGEGLFLLRDIERYYSQSYGPQILQQQAQSIKESVMVGLERLYVLKQYAQDKGITLDDESNKEIEELLSEYKESVPPGTLEKDGITDEDIRSVFELNFLSKKVIDAELTDFKVDEAKIEENLLADPFYQNIEKFGVEEALKTVKVQHILISTKDEAGSEKSEEEVAKAKEEAGRIMKLFTDEGKTFEELVTEYSEDPGKVSNNGVYEFGRGEMVPEFEEASFTMKNGDTQIVKSDFGFHIINKIDETLPDQETVDKVMEYKDLAKEREIDAQKSAEFDEVYKTSIEGKYDVTKNQELWNNVKMSYEMNEESSENTEVETSSDK